MKRLGPINWGDPVVREHPLNQGRVAWWLAAPSFYGMTWRDLMGQNTGTLTNMVQGATSGFNATTRPGGFGEMRLQVSAPADSIAVNSPVHSSSTMTVSTWIYLISTPTYPTIASNGSFFVGGWWWFLNNSEPSGMIFRTSQLGTFQSSSSSGGIVFGTWNHIAVAFDGATARFYTNGFYDSSGSNTTPAAPATNMVIGDYTGGGYSVNGMMDDLSIYSRALSASEIQSIYQESRRGYPNTLRRMAPAYARLSTVIRRLLYKDASRSI